MRKIIQYSARAIVKAFYNFFGMDVVSSKNVPKKTLAGLKQRPILTVIDVGANRGQFAQYISQHFPEAALYCFEPLGEPFQVLSAWATTQNNRVQCFNVAP